ncbi:MAG TPA: hypothetical protein VK929_15875 [Longimicrobiales bacterium]|nr:hypothetical protein [Longimicrobiales bacterium]
MISIRSLRHVPLAALVFTLAACDDAPVEPPMMADVAGHELHAAGKPAHAVPVRAHGDLLKAVRAQTARFNSTTQALRAGYEPDTHCAAHPMLGGMGYHWVNGGLIDPVFDPMQPEAVLYEDGPGGNLRLVAVEYIVIDVGQPHPHFGDHPLDVGGVPPLMAAGVPHYSLHVWAHKDNPAGVFEPFNPNVSCD